VVRALSDATFMVRLRIAAILRGVSDFELMRQWLCSTHVDWPQDFRTSTPTRTSIETPDGLRI